MDHPPEDRIRDLAFRLDRKGLFEVIRLTARGRFFRRAAIPALAGFVLIGHSLEGNYVKGLLWAAGVVVLFWGLSRLMIFLNVYGCGNETLLVPQRIRLFDDHMLVTSEHSREEFPRPEPAEASATQKYLLIPMGRNNLVFLKRSFEEPEEYEELKTWALGEKQIKN